MGMTLQDVIDAAVTVPEKYGHVWFALNTEKFIEAICPLAKEVVADQALKIGRGCDDLVRLCSERLGCTEKDVRSFLTWWDSGRRPSLIRPWQVDDALRMLRESGFVLPDKSPGGGLI